jgi:hypothetical protein
MVWVVIGCISVLCAVLSVVIPLAVLFVAARGSDAGQAQQPDSTVTVQAQPSVQAGVPGDLTAGWRERANKFEPDLIEPEPVTIDNRSIADLFRTNLVKAKQDSKYLWALVVDPKSDVGKYLAKTEVFGTGDSGEDNGAYGDGTGTDRTIPMHLLLGDTTGDRSRLVTFHFTYREGFFLVAGLHVDATGKTYGTM